MNEIAKHTSIETDRQTQTHKHTHMETPNTPSKKHRDTDRQKKQTHIYTHNDTINPSQSVSY